MNRGLWYCFAGQLVLGQIFLGGIALGSPGGQAEQSPAAQQQLQAAAAQPRTETTQEYNKRLQQLIRAADRAPGTLADQDYRVGPDDLLDVSVFEAPDLNRTVRVSAEGDILLPLLGNVQPRG